MHQNQDSDRPVQILVNHGYVAGLCPDRLQPLWSAYRFAGVTRGVDFYRPHLYYADDRIDVEHRVESQTFGKYDNVQYHVGHLVPNEVINRQFGRLAQLETFLMTNMSPQRRSLNTGIWLKLENAIRNIEDTGDREHVWAIAGPVFGDQPDSIERLNGQKIPIPIPIPKAFYCVTVDPFRYPWDEKRNVDVLCFHFPQDAATGTSPEEYSVDLEDIEAATKLRFFAGWNHNIGESLRLEAGRISHTWHRLARALAY